MRHSQLPISTQRRYWRGMSDFDNAIPMDYVDDTGMIPRGIPEPLIYSVDQNGYPLLVNANSSQPWWANLASQGIDVAGDYLSNRRNFGFDPRQGAAVQAQVTPQGISTGLNLSSNTLLLIGVVAAVFLLGKRGR